MRVLKELDLARQGIGLTMQFCEKIIHFLCKRVLLWIKGNVLVARQGAVLLQFLCVVCTSTPESLCSALDHLTIVRLTERPKNKK